MRRDMRIWKVRDAKNTTRFEPDGKGYPMSTFYPNTEALSVLPFDTDELILSMSDAPFAAGEVGLAFPPIPFYEIRGRSVLYQHTAGRTATSKRKPRPAPNTPELPVTQQYVIRSFLEDDFVARKKPLYLAISAVTETVIEDEKQPTSGSIAVVEAIDRADALATLDEFLRDYVRVKRGSRLTSRQIWAMWAKYHKADSAEEIIHGIRLTDVARRFRAVFGVKTVKGTRIDGQSQRYWEGYIINAA